MARPIRNNAEFFYHPASLRDDRRVKAIRAQTGACGYGLLMMLMETLTDADFTQLDTSELELELLAGDYGVSVTEINSLLQIGERVGYFSRNEAGFLICPDLDRALEPVFDKRNRSRNTANSGKNDDKSVEPVVSATETPQSATESTHSRREDSTVQDTTETTTTSSTAQGEDFEPVGQSEPTNVEAKPADEETNLRGDSYFDFNIRLKSERTFIESTCMSLKISLAEMPALIDAFTHEQRALEKDYKGEFPEFKSHCFHWLRIQATKQPFSNGTPHNAQVHTPARTGARSGQHNGNNHPTGQTANSYSSRRKGYITADDLARGRSGSGNTPSDGNGRTIILDVE